MAGIEASLYEGLPSLDEIERRYLIHVLSHVAGNRKRAAEIMGIDRRTLYRMLERFGIVQVESEPPAEPSRADG